MTRSSEELRGITLLGNQHTQYKTEYAPEVLEAFDNKHPDNDYSSNSSAPNYQPVPDDRAAGFATIHIRYIPGKKMVESKSLKLYFCSASAITAISTKTASISYEGFNRTDAAEVY